MTMQEQNLNSKENYPPRRRVQVYYKNSFFDPFDKSQNSIVNQFQFQTERDITKSLGILIKKIRNSSCIQNSQQSNPFNKKLNSNDSDADTLTTKKELRIKSYQQDDQESIQNEINDYIKKAKGVKQVKANKVIKYSLPQKKDEFIDKATAKLYQSFDKLNLQDESEERDKPNSEKENFNQNKPRFAEDIQGNEQEKASIQHMSLSELMQQSFKKSNNKIYQNTNNINTEKVFSDDSDVEYPMTNSDQQNSDNDYDQKYQQQGKSSLFGNKLPLNHFKPGNFALGKNFATGSTVGSIDTLKFGMNKPHTKALNFKPIMDSPKKSKSKIKRLFINKKKVPRWAQDLQKIEKAVDRQCQQRQEQGKNNPLGICIIENLNTDHIFGIEGQTQRNSTARWGRGENDN